MGLWPGSNTPPPPVSGPAPVAPAPVAAPAPSGPALPAYTGDPGSYKDLLINQFGLKPNQQDRSTLDFIVNALNKQAGGGWSVVGNGQYWDGISKNGQPGFKLVSGRNTFLPGLQTYAQAEGKGSAGAAAGPRMGGPIAAGGLTDVGGTDPGMSQSVRDALQKKSSVWEKVIADAGQDTGAPKSEVMPVDTSAQQPINQQAMRQVLGAPNGDAYATGPYGKRVATSPFDPSLYTQMGWAPQGMPQ